MVFLVDEGTSGRRQSGVSGVTTDAVISRSRVENVSAARLLRMTVIDHPTISNKQQRGAAHLHPFWSCLAELCTA